MSKIKSLTVYCSASDDIDSKFINIAKKFGIYLAKNNIRLVYGGGNHGMMGAVSHACLKNNGHALGIMPYNLIGIEGFINHPNLQYIYLSTMAERKYMLETKAQGAIILPGGLGTMDEMFAIITLQKLKLYEHPIWLLNAFHYYAPLLEMFHHMHDKKFATMPQLITTSTVEELQQSVTSYL